MSTSNTIRNNSQSQNGMLKQVVSDAKDFCSTAIIDDQLKRAIEQISNDVDSLTPDQRKQLQEIGQFMTEGHTAPITAMARDGDFDLKLSDDRMYLLLSAKPPIAGGKAVTTSDIIHTLREQKITTGVDVPKIQAALQKVAQGEECDNVAIVHGRPATPGTNGSVQIQARSNLTKPLQYVNINLDAPDKNERLLCLEGDCVLLHMPPVQGKEGTDAQGQPLAPLPVKDEVLDAGPNIRVEEHKFIAEISGMLQLENRKLSILPILFLSTDVTRLQGPIDFDGQVIVQATVRDGSSLKATGDITVHGNVEAAGIESTQGNITVMQGIVGRNEAILAAKKSIHARFVENASLRADENIMIENGALHSNLVAGHTIDITKGKGHLIGGSALAGELIITRILGTISGMKTNVSAGLSGKAMKLLAKLDQALLTQTTKLQTCRQLLERMHHLVRDPSKMDKSSLESLAKLKQIQLILDVKIAHLEKQKMRVMEFASNEGQGVIKVLEDFYPGVTVRLGKHLHIQAQPGRAKQFELDPTNQRILVKPLKR